MRLPVPVSALLSVVARSVKRKRWPALGAVVLAACAGVQFQASASAPAAPALPVAYVFPVPGAHVASPSTQIAFRGVSVAQLGTVQVSGSQSGSHAGTVKGDSDGDGASFIPTSQFTPGEVVTVTAPSLNIEGTGSTSFQFTVANPASGLPLRSRPVATRVPGDVWRFQSYPYIAPAAVTLLKRSNRAAPGDIFLAPWRGPVQDGPEIIDQYGHLVWFKAIPAPYWTSDFRVQTYLGKPVLTWWQGRVTGSIGEGYGVINDTSYTQLRTVQAANGLSSDVHEFEISPSNTAFFTADYPVYWDARSAHGLKRQIVVDAVVQEIDIPTGLVLFQWDSLDHVALTDSYVAAPKSRSVDWDYFHVNSIEPDHDGNLVISGRDTFAAYKVDRRTANTIWTLGGRHSSFKMGPGAGFAWQHDVRVRAANDLYITLFDDGAGYSTAPGHTQSRGLKLRLDFNHMTATAVTQYNHPPPLLASFAGNMQQLSDFHDFVGWGSQPYFSEFGSRGRLLLDGRFVGDNVSYRVWKFQWVGAPHTLPRIATRNIGQSTVVWVSWNGSTNVASWRVLGGSTANALQPLRRHRRRGFETVITVPAQTYVAAQALDAQGHVLATSAATHT